MDEFELIRRYFSRQAGDADVVLGVGDDGAVLRPDAGRDLVAVVDTLVDGVHYPAGFPAGDVGYRAVAVNLSDIAAMGARPRWMTLALTLAAAEADWLEAFAGGLYEAADEHGVTLVGGDTTSGSQTVVSVQLIGDVEPDRALRRSGARPGDRLFVSGFPGDAAAGLELLRTGGDTPAAARLIAKFRRPAARLALGSRATALASAAIDVSDGLVDDVGKLLAASGTGGVIHVESLPLSESLTSTFDAPRARAFALGGGDDYELCLTAAPADAPALVEAADELGLPLTEIGEVTDGGGLRCLEAGRVIDVPEPGYRHFRDSGA